MCFFRLKLFLVIILFGFADTQACGSGGNCSSDEFCYKNIECFACSKVDKECSGYKDGQYQCCKELVCTSANEAEYRCRNPNGPQCGTDNTECTVPIGGSSSCCAGLQCIPQSLAQGTCKKCTGGGKLCKALFLEFADCCAGSACTDVGLGFYTCQ